ncbi:response regulator transcription factor [Streptomyces sp. AJS327]|uniref:helix-turn-helix transcriptional regulator n=1 Tax=Streptomyces sp. AJS327 TaxID=2545265 RepID=UPI0015DF2113|nr:LuxR C-terminal-related transcriptional regulator [Streptomyces sp. AJS327]MBA0053160.1 response regulator transcription factor [Streptomyces sp. AJS327]
MAKASGKSDAHSADLTLALYRELRQRGASSFDELATGLDLTPDHRDRCRSELLELGLIVPTGATHDSRLAVESGERSEQQTDGITAIDPEIALLRLVERQRVRLREHLSESEQVYGTLEVLAERFLRVRSERSDAEVEVFTDYRRIQQALEDISEVVQHEQASMHPTALQREFPERVLKRDQRLLDNGVRVRAIYNQRFTTVPEQVEYFRRKAEIGVELRLAPVVPMNMILADQQYALLPVNPEDPSEGAVHARGSALVRSYAALYEYCWHTATPYGEQAHPERGGDGLSEQQQAALRMLASGVKDERIARSLGVSVRTVSRLVSELMQELGASSRFEAGVRAARLGWLD